MSGGWYSITHYEVSKEEPRCAQPKRTGVNVPTNMGIVPQR